MQWVVQGAVNVDIGANPSAEGAGEDEGVDDQTVKVVDIVDTFRLQVRNVTVLSHCYLIYVPPLDFKQVLRVICRNNLLLTRSNLSHT